MASQPLVNTALDMLDEAASLVEEAVGRDPLDPDSRLRVEARLRRLEAALDHPAPKGRAAAA